MADFYPYRESKPWWVCEDCLKFWSSFQLYLWGFEDTGLVNLALFSSHSLCFLCFTDLEADGVVI